LVECERWFALVARAHWKLATGRAAADRTPEKDFPVYAIPARIAQHNRPNATADAALSG